MKFIVITLICLAAIGQLAATRLHSASHEWKTFKHQFGKSYTGPEEEARRFANYLATKARVERHNADQSSTYKMAVNHLADWHAHELAKLNGIRFNESMLVHELPEEDARYLREILGVAHDDDDDQSLPKEVDWRKVPGRVSEVKDQGQCGSCWAFATTGLLEGQQVTRKIFNDIVLLSEQELVDCTPSNFGCDGGIMKLALNDIKLMGGIDSEKDYPYTSVADEFCTYRKHKPVMSDEGAIVLPANNEKLLMKTVAKYGPVSVAIFATNKFQQYQSGIFTDTTCPVDQINHGVLVVGYGTDANAGDYWIVKNSWGNAWGEQGYIRMSRGSNMCSIASLPTIAKF